MVGHGVTVAERPGWVERGQVMRHRLGGVHETKG
jgi:hypothetical protein